MIPKVFHDTVVSSFLEFYDFYEEICTSNTGSKDGQDLVDPLFANKHGLYNYNSVLERLRALKKKYEDHESKMEED